MHKKQASLVPLTHDFAVSSCEQPALGGPGRDSSEEGVIAAVASSKPSPGKVLARRGSKSQRLHNGE